MLNVVIFGAPGSGKGTQSERIIEEYGLFHISTGDVLREQIARGTELGKTADSYISKGQLIPDELMVNILAHVLDSHEESKKGVPSDYRSGRGLDSDACRTQCPSRCCLGA
mgnify:CR=1 FL=1